MDAVSVQSPHYVMIAAARFVKVEVRRWHALIRLFSGHRPSDRRRGAGRKAPLASPRPSTPPLRRSGTIAALAALAVVAVYVVAVGTAPGRHVDSLLRLHDFGSGAAYRTAATLLDTINWQTVAAGALAAVLSALWWHGPGCALRIVEGLGGVYVTQLFLSLMLARFDPLGGEAVRLEAGYYPSGHAAMVAALGWACVLAAPTAARWIIAGLVAGISASVGVIIVVLHSHYPSDVIGGWLVAVGCMAAAATHRRCGGDDGAPQVLQSACERAAGEGQPPDD